MSRIRTWWKSLRRRTPLLAGLAVVSGMLGLYVLQPPLLRQLDHKVYDAFLLAGAGGEPSPVPVVVDIDERSLAAWGQWPWPRYRLARLIEILSDAGAAAVALDVLLAEADRSSLVRVREDMKRDLGLDLSFGRVPSGLEDNDVLLARVLARAPVVLGAFMRFDGDAPAVSGETPPRPVGTAEIIPAGSPSPRALVTEARGGVWPLPVFTDVAPVGPINVAPDHDGVIRAMPLLFRLGDAVYPNLSLRALMRGLDADTLVLASGPDGLERIGVGPLWISVSPQGLMQVPFRGPRGVYPSFSAADVLEGKTPQGAFEGAIVFVGASAAGLQDIRATPFDAMYPGVEAHAAMVDAVLSGRSLVLPPWTPGAQVLAIVLGGGLAAALFSLARPVLSLPMGLVLAAGSVAASARLFRNGLFLSPVYLTLTVGAVALAVLAVRFWSEESRRRALRRAFSRYVTPEVVDRIADSGMDVFAGEEKEVTVLFSDVRGFTSLAETLRPEQVVALLNRYFTPMTACIRNGGGTLDKFMGDAIMAFWNAPLDVDAHPERAVRAALSMRERLAGLRPELRAEFGVELTMGMGIHTGPAYVGNMGSEELLDYTCIGDNVNLAARLESLSGRYGTDLLVSGETARRCPPDLTFLPFDTIRVKGRTHAVDIGTVLSPAEAAARGRELDVRQEAMALYRQGAFLPAEALFRKLAASGKDERLYLLFSGRCRTLAGSPPQDWNGVWTFDSK